MIPTVHSLQEAQEFFLTHASGSCWGMREGDADGRELTTYPEAEDFYKNP